MNKKTIYKLIFLILIVTILSILINLLNPKNGLMICTYQNKTDIYNINTKYKVKFKNKVVTNIYTEEIFKSNDEKMLNEYKTSLDLMYSKYNNLKYYDNFINIENNQLISKTNINYEKIDISKFISIDKNNRKLLTNNKISLKTIKRIYKEKGARCTYK